VGIAASRVLCLDKTFHADVDPDMGRV
jgi:hypothetical protein